MKRTAYKQRGFTLIELMVSLAIFSVIMVVIAGAYLTVVSIDRQSRTLSELVNNLSFVTDTMSREIRTGTDFCNADGNYFDGNFDCTAGSSGAPQYTNFYFINQNGCEVEYYLSSGQIYESVASGPASCETLNQPITEQGVNITNLSFYVHDPGTGSGGEPTVVYTISGTITADAKHTETFTIETAATQRTINVTTGT